jgi:hypothetical protein
VRMLDGTLKTLLVDDSQPVANLMVVICTKIGGYTFDFFIMYNCIHFRILYFLFLSKNLKIRIYKAIILPAVRFDVLMVMKIQVVFLWVVILCSDVVGYKCFSGSCCLHPEDRSSEVIRNIGILLHHYVMSQPRRTQLELFYQFYMSVKLGFSL